MTVALMLCWNRLSLLSDLVSTGEIPDNRWGTFLSPRIITNANRSIDVSIILLIGVRIGESLNRSSCRPTFVHSNLVLLCLSVCLALAPYPLCEYHYIFSWAMSNADHWMSLSERRLPRRKHWCAISGWSCVEDKPCWRILFTCCWHATRRC